jgi:hypothetical protein
MQPELITLDCPNCGENVFVADVDGTFAEDDDGTCEGCGLQCTVSIDSDGDAYVNHNDVVVDKGQPRCMGQCGAIKEAHGTPCYWDCGYAKNPECGRLGSKPRLFNHPDGPVTITPTNERWACTKPQEHPGDCIPGRLVVNASGGRVD